jgi:rhodanese-related sulfurtransferase
MVIHPFWNGTKEVFAAPTISLRLKRCVLQTGLLFVSLFIFSVFYHAFVKTGFLKNPAAIAEVTRRYYSVNIPEISRQEMQRFVLNGVASLFDARYARDFNNGTIPRSKSLPINSSLTERQQALAGLSRNQQIVVYCQSNRCNYSDEVTQFLKFNGYHNVVIYRGGYHEWDTQKEK